MPSQSLSHRSVVLCLTLAIAQGFVPPRPPQSRLRVSRSQNKCENDHIASFGLPIDAVIPNILTALRSSAPQLVLQAPPGAGKTTCVPLAILADNDASVSTRISRMIPSALTLQSEEAEPGSHWLAPDQTIVMLEPRRLAARGAATRMASSLNERVGQTVGYVVKQDAVVSASTRIECVTEGVLLRRLQSDPLLEGVGCVVLDEFHERSLDADLALALLLDLQRSGIRPDLRLVVMSATVGDSLCQRLVGVGQPSLSPIEQVPQSSEGQWGEEEQDCLMPGGSLVASQGREFPVDIRYLGRPNNTPLRGVLRRWELEESVAEAVCKALTLDRGGDVLAFLPGEAEIRGVLARLERILPSHSGLREDVELLPLYGALPHDQQMRAVAPTETGNEKRKVIVSSPIAEASLTLPGVTCVVDSGLRRAPTFDSGAGLAGLTTRPVSAASATQRAGRAGRVAPGVCFRLWSKQDQARLAPAEQAPIFDADLAPLALEAAVWLDSTQGGLSSTTSTEESVIDLLAAIQALPWVDPPPTRRLVDALDLLYSLGALESSTGWVGDEEGEAAPGDTSGGDEGLSIDDAGNAAAVEEAALNGSARPESDGAGGGGTGADVESSCRDSTISSSGNASSSNAEVPTPKRWWRLTAHGRRLAALPLHPRLAHMIAAAVDLDAPDSTTPLSSAHSPSPTPSVPSSSFSSPPVSFVAEACFLAAVLQERTSVLGRGSAAATANNRSPTDLRAPLQAVREALDGCSVASTGGPAQPAPPPPPPPHGRGFSKFALRAVRETRASLLKVAAKFEPRAGSPWAGKGPELVRLATLSAGASSPGGVAPSAASSKGARAKDAPSTSDGGGVVGPPLPPDVTGALLALAYPDRVAKRRPSSNGNNNRFTMANGVGAMFRDPFDPLPASSEWVVVCEQGTKSQRGSAAAPAPRSRGDDDDSHRPSSIVAYVAAPLPQGQLELVLGRGGGEGGDANSLDEKSRASSSGQASSLGQGGDSSSGSGGGSGGGGAGGTAVRTVTSTFVSPSDGTVRRKTVTSLLGRLVLRESPAPPPPPRECALVLLQELQRDLLGCGLLSRQQIDALTELRRRVDLAYLTDDRHGPGHQRSSPDAHAQNEEEEEEEEEDSEGTVAATPQSAGWAEERMPHEAALFWPDWSLRTLSATVFEWFGPHLLEKAESGSGGAGGGGSQGVVGKKLVHSVDLEDALFEHWSALSYQLRAEAPSSGSGSEDPRPFVENNGGLAGDVGEGGLGASKLRWRRFGCGVGGGGTEDLSPHALKSLLDQVAPTRVKVPSGATVGLRYREQSHVEPGASSALTDSSSFAPASAPSVVPPVLSVKLQEIFGLAQAPSVGCGSVCGASDERSADSKGGLAAAESEPLRSGNDDQETRWKCSAVRVTVELLAPNGRVCATTSDLSSFWLGACSVQSDSGAGATRGGRNGASSSGSGYASVRAELRGRYPKHPWPEDPVNAVPTRFTTKRLKEQHMENQRRKKNEGASSNESSESDRSEKRGPKKQRGKKKKNK